MKIDTNKGGNLGMNYSTFTFKSSNNKNMIHGVIWAPEVEPTAILQIAHGMTEYIERYDEFARFMVDNKILVVGNDHIGHGKSVDSENEWGYFAKKDGSACVVEDMHHLTKIMKKKYPDTPYYLLGHSMGSFMVRRYIMNYGKALTGAIITGTGNQPYSMIIGGKALVKIDTLFRGEKYRSKFIEMIMFGGYNNRIKDAKTPCDWLTTDEAIVEKYLKEPSCTFIFTLNGFNSLLDTILYIMKKKNIKRIPKNLPILIASGVEDPVGNYGKDVQSLYEELKKTEINNIQLKLYKGCRHEILNEVTRQTVYQDILEWILTIN